MAILGKNGLWAAALYLAAVWGLYGQKDAGFHDPDGWEKDLESIEQLVDRKRVAEVSGNKTATARIVEEIRAGRVRAAVGAKRGGSKGFREAYMKQTTFVR